MSLHPIGLHCTGHLLIC